MRRTTAVLVAGAVAVALGIGSLLGGVLTETRPARPTTAAAPRLDLRPLSRGSAAGAARRRLSRCWRRGSPTPPLAIPTASGRWASRTRFAGARPATRGSSRARSERFGTLSRERDRATTATLGLGNLALIRHDFRGALALGRRAAPGPVRSAAVRRRG